MENREKEANLGWNWGAFMMPLQFGIGNKAYLTLLILVPFLNFVWYFVCGAQGAKWAFDSGYFANVDEFNGAMKTWNRSGFVMFIFVLAAFAFYFLLLFGALGFASGLSEFMT